MELPDLTRIIDTYVPVLDVEHSAYLNQLQQDVLPHIRSLQANGHLRWFSFLLHGAGQLGEREPADDRCFIHLRLEPASDLDLQEFIGRLPNHFLNPIIVSLPTIGGFDVSTLRDDNGAYTWKIHGECSEWILCLLEGHKGTPSLEHIFQFLHYITNPLMLGHKCFFIPSAIRF